MNFARDVVDSAPADRLALVELTREGSRREWSFGEVSVASAALAGRLTALGVGRGDVVMTLIGNRPEWVLTMVACFRIGAVALPCNEQLRAGDLRLRLVVASPQAIVTDARNRRELEAAAPDCPVLEIPDESLWTGDFAGCVELDARDPCLITFTSGTTGEPKGIVHGQRYLPGQALQASSLARCPGRRPRLVHRGQRLVEVGPQRVHRAVDARAPRRCCTTPASIRPSAWSCWRASASTCCAWRRPSTG